MSRLESTQAPIAKDTILNLPSSPKTIPATDGLPDIPVPQTASATETVTSAINELPDIIAEAVVPLVSIGESGGVSMTRIDLLLCLEQIRRTGSGSDWFRVLLYACRMDAKMARVFTCYFRFTVVGRHRNK